MRPKKSAAKCGETSIFNIYGELRRWYQRVFRTWFVLDRMNNDTRMYHVQAESVQTLTETSYSIYHMVMWNVDDVTQMITTRLGLWHIPRRILGLGRCYP